MFKRVCGSERVCVRVCVCVGNEFCMVMLWLFASIRLNVIYRLLFHSILS